MDCKKALVATDGDMDAAIEHLRKTGMAKAEKKAGRSTNEGKIVTRIEGGTAVMAEVLCETDFVAKNETFGAYCDALAGRIVTDYSEEGDLSEQVATAEAGNIGDLVTNVGENIQLKRVVRWQLAGEAASYLHAGGKIGVLVEVAGASDDAFRHDLCMHIAAYSPVYLNPDAVPAEVIEKEKEIAAALPDLANKPENILGKIIEGKIRKWYTETCLTKQAWLRDDKIAVEKASPGADIKRFVRWQVGEAS
jgi:elongation factor Ts